MQIGELRTRLQQLRERVNLLRDGCGREIVHAFERDIDHQLTFVRQRVGHRERDTRFHGLHSLVEVFDVDIEELAIADGGQRFERLARQVGEDAHHERELDSLIGTVNFDVVFDLDARSTITCDEFLRTGRSRHSALRLSLK
ncbi:hypothetical protein HDG41_004291 [Paraburkholderia sp. JPY162]|uniref:Uncharacterized protein n=1 Tax=Paraburkholderia youngii TaxID=2782701 RepID=A0A7W8L8R8_9BURK|nr:hypothetical protein [Paraburkholderia youngii]